MEDSNRRRENGREKEVTGDAKKARGDCRDIDSAE